MTQSSEMENQQVGRLRLLEAAVRLFGRDGFDGTSLRALADEAEVSWGLIRFYFGSKEGLRDAAEALVISRYLGLVVDGSRSSNLDDLFHRIDSETRLPDDASFLRRALIEDRPVAQNFLQQLIALQQRASNESELLRDFPDEEWLKDAIRPVAMRLGYLMLAPQIKSLLGRDVFSAPELKRRNRQLMRESELIRLGLEAERDRKRKGAKGSTTTPTQARRVD